METPVSFLLSPPILALSNWNDPFRLHPGASEIGAGAVLTQVPGIREPLILGNRRKEVAERSGMPCRTLGGRQVCFVSSGEIVHPHRRLLCFHLVVQESNAFREVPTGRLMQYDTELQWRPGTQHQRADTLSRSHGSTPPVAMWLTTPSLAAM